ncbi:dihydrofolate reductase family protein [Sagittula sp. S175]|uniref:dihydrofolate reductase family protein n=1 Tax=Sagittula sp. S175 TaxID=3415129 RepID=UPI003C7AB4BC
MTGRPDRVALGASAPIGLCFDRHARLVPESGVLDGGHLVLVLPETAPQGHVDALEARGVSVFFDRGDRRDVLARVAGAFGVETLLLEGGGALNGAFLTEGLIDETSTLMLPLVDGRHGMPAIYDAPETAVRRADLLSVDTPGDSSVWLRHVLT